MKRLALSLFAFCLVALPTIGHATTTAPGSSPSPKPTPPPVQDQSTVINSSRSNIKNNLAPATSYPSGVHIPNNLQIVQGPGGTLNCRVSVEGVKGDTACTPAQVKAIAASIPPPSALQLSLAKDGTTLLCGTKPCTAAHLKALNEAARVVPHGAPL